MDVVGDDREYEWSLDGQRWLQDAHGRFSLTHIAGKALEDAQAQLQDSVHSLQHYSRHTEIDPAALQALPNVTGVRHGHDVTGIDLA